MDGNLTYFSSYHDNVHAWTDRQTDGRTGRQTDGWTDRQTETETDRQYFQIFFVLRLGTEMLTACCGVVSGGPAFPFHCRCPFIYLVHFLWKTIKKQIFSVQSIRTWHSNTANFIVDLKSGYCPTDKHIKFNMQTHRVNCVLLCY